MEGGVDGICSTRGDLSKCIQDFCKQLGKYDTVWEALGFMFLYWLGDCKLFKENPAPIIYCTGNINYNVIWH
jgi:hypothetical protein